MGKVIPMAGGGVADLEAVTAGAGDVVSPKVFINNDGNPVTGIMSNYRNSVIPRNGNTADIVGVGDYWETSSGKGGDIKIKTIYGGCYNSNTILSQAVYGLHPEVVKAGALIGPNIEESSVIRGTYTSDATAYSSKVLKDYVFYAKGVRGVGTIPIQNKEIEDRVYATNISAWTGVICLGVRKNYYLNEVNWIQANIPNLAPANIKKGVNIGGIIGTCEGYFPTPTDLYYMGNNPAGFTSGSQYVTFYLDHIQISDTAQLKSISSKVKFNMTGHNTLNVEGEFCNGASSGRILTYMHGDGTGWWSFATHTFAGSTCTGRTIISVPLAVNLGQRFISLDFGSSITGNIFRIWLT